MTEESQPVASVPFRPSGVDYRVNGALQRVHGYQMVMGLVDSMVDVARTPEVCLLKEVIRLAVSDLAGPMLDQDPVEAHDFLFGSSGRLYFDALGIDPEMIRDHIVRHMPGEMARVIRLKAARNEEARELARLNPVEDLFLDCLMDGPIDCDSIAKKMGVTHATIRRLVKNMAEAGHIEMDCGPPPSKLSGCDVLRIARTRKAA